MKEIRLENQYYRYTLLLDEEGRLFHGCFLPSDMAEQVNPEEQAKRSPLPLEAIVNVDDEPLQLSHGVRYFYPRCSVRSPGSRWNRTASGRLSPFWMRKNSC